MTIDPADVYIENWPPAPKGPHVPRLPATGVKATHKPTRISVVVSKGRHQHLNAQQAMDRLAVLVEAATKNTQEGP